MKLEKREKTIITIVIALIIILIFFFFFFKTKNCGNNEACFNAYAADCKEAKATLQQEGNLFTYEIKGSKKNNCIITIKVEKLNPATEENIKKLFEGKGMVCSIPKNIIEETEITNMQEVVDYCTGPLKEAIYELVIEKLYAVVAQNIGDIVIEMENLFKETE